jgi:hypothetical protein
LLVNHLESGSHGFSEEFNRLVKTANSNFGRDVVTIYVGEEKTPFIVDKALLCEHSAYFARAFNGKFQEATSQSTNVPDVEVSTWKIFMQWLYLQRLRVPLSDMEPAKDKTVDLDAAFVGDNLLFKDKTVDSYHVPTLAMLHVFMLAEIYDTKALRNDVMTALFNLNLQTKCYCGFRVMPTELASLRQTSAFMQYSIYAQAAQLIDREGLTEECQNAMIGLPSWLLVDLVNIIVHHKMKILNPKINLNFKYLCSYHEHDSEVERLQCKTRQKDKGEAIFIRNLQNACIAVTLADERGKDLNKLV